MPNHVTNKITFAADQLSTVLAHIGTGDNFDFNRLIPAPAHMYRGSLGMDDDKDFPCNWYDWQSEHWGTKWNAYDFSSGIDGDCAFIQFDTAWAAPFPIIAAFANAFPTLAFEHSYFDEGYNFWGIDHWTTDGVNVGRNTKRYKHADDKRPLCMALKGYDPDDDKNA